MLYLYWILFFWKNFIDYENIYVIVQILQCHWLNPLPPKCRSDVFRSKMSLRVAPNKVILDNYNLKPTEPLSMNFLNEHDLINLIINNTCLKGERSCIDLTLINRKYSFKNSNSFETGLSHHHCSIYSMVKTTFHKEKSKTLIYCNYKTLFSKLESQENNEYQKL